MYWADKVADEIIKSGKYKPYRVDDMFTPSGFAHLGSLRGPLIHDLIYKALIHAGVDAKFSYVFNDFDPIDGLPKDLEKDFSKYLAFPLRSAPSPKEGFNSFGEFFSADFKNVLKNLGVESQFYSSWDLYHEGKFDEAIKIALDNAEKIQDIYQRVSGSKKREQGWLPLQVICENCGKIGTTKVHDWDGKTVAYNCEENLVKWAKGCGHSGIISPFGGNGKLPWKVDWPAHWMVLGVTIEGSGKDHSSAGGSRDIARELCNKVFHIEEPYNLPYEFFLIGGKKMASSKGLGLKARDASDLLPPQLVRFLFSRTDYRQAVEFDPMGTMAIPDLFDEYDRCFTSYINGTNDDLERTFEMSQIGEPPPKVKTLLPRFRDVVNYIQMPDIDLQKKYEAIKDGLLTSDELKNLKEREKYARIWLGQYAPEEYRVQMSEKLPARVKELSNDQKKFLRKVAELMGKENNPEILQLALYKLTKELGIESKRAFSAIYIVLTGKEFGPRAAWFLLQYPKEKIIKRLQEASS